MLDKNVKGKIDVKMVGDKATLSIIGDIGYGYTDNTSDHFTSLMDGILSSGVQEIEVRINSFGGSVTDAFEIHNQLERFKGSKTAYIGAVCASAATVIALACEKRIGSSNTLWMIHNPSVSAVGDANDLEAATQIYNVIRNNVVSLYFKATGLDAKKIEKMMDATTWLSAEEALAQGWLTSIGDATVLETPELPEATVEMQIPVRLIAKMKNLNSNPYPSPNMQLKERIVSTMMMSNTSSDEEVAQAIIKLHNERNQLKAELDAKKLEVAKEKAKMLIEKAISEKRITEAEKEQWLLDAEKNYELSERALMKIQPTILASNHIGKGDTGQNDPLRTNWTMKDWQEKDWEGLMKMRENAQEKYQALVKAHYKAKI